VIFFPLPGCTFFLHPCSFSLDNTLLDFAAANNGTYTHTWLFLTTPMHHYCEKVVTVSWKHCSIQQALASMCTRPHKQNWSHTPCCTITNASRREELAKQTMSLLANMCTAEQWNSMSLDCDKIMKSPCYSMEKWNKLWVATGYADHRDASAHSAPHPEASVQHSCEACLIPNSSASSIPP
jgi:hypothetical protein